MGDVSTARGGSKSEIFRGYGRRGRNRTCNPRIRNPMLYPFELRAREKIRSYFTLYSMIFRQSADAPERLGMSLNPHTGISTVSERIAQIDILYWTRLAASLTLAAAFFHVEESVRFLPALLVVGSEISIDRTVLE
jgi:hypothetical protein